MIKTEESLEYVLNMFIDGFKPHKAVNNATLNNLDAQKASEP